VEAAKKGRGGAGPRLGRPYDGSIRRKVINAAIDCYAERGWSGFSFEAVSIRAKVGRPALYRRWSGREDLLVDAFRESTQTLLDPDHGNLRDDLTDLALGYRRQMAGARGRAGMRLFLEQGALPEVFRTVSLETSAQRDVLILEAFRRGQSRGEVRKEADLDVALRLLIGSLMLDALIFYKTPQQIRSTVMETIETLLRGIGNIPSTDLGLGSPTENGLDLSRTSLGH
jgi:AcrR family transcriptional regulator